MFLRCATILKAKRPTLPLMWIVCALAGALIGGCGQRGPLYIPSNDPAAAQRATLPQAIMNVFHTPKAPISPASSPASSAASAPASTPTTAAPQESASGSEEDRPEEARRPLPSPPP